MLEAPVSEKAEPAPLFGVRIKEEKGRRQVRLSKRLKQYPILDPDGRAIGYAYGAVLRSPSKNFMVLGDTIRVTAPIPDIRAFEELVLDELQGTFLVETQNDLPSRLYPDSGTTLPVIYCPQTRRIGSSAAMILDEDEYRRRFLAERHQRLVGSSRHSWLPGTLTVHEGLSRLLPNHYLDLETWQPIRFWPRADEFSQDLGFEEATGSVARALESFLAAAADQFRLGITLTAGLDSRLLLAAARPVVDKVEFFTISPEREGIDQILARRMARDHGLRYQTFALVKSSAEDMARWDKAVGHAVREVNQESYLTVGQLPYDVIMTGMFGGAGKGLYYAKDQGKINRKTVTAGDLLSRMSCPRDADLIADLTNWLAGLEGVPSSAILDLAYVELRSVGWGTSQYPIQNAEILQMNPIAQRTIVSAFLSVPPGEKKDKRLIKETIRSMWPDLMEYEVNRFGNYRDYTKLLSKLLDREAVIRYVRRHLSG
jgi:hypothetical protein